MATSNARQTQRDTSEASTPETMRPVLLAQANTEGNTPSGSQGSSSPGNAQNAPAPSAVQASPNGFRLGISKAAVDKVVVSDVDLMLIMKNGQRVTLVGAAIDAISGQAMQVDFADARSSASDLLKSVKEIGASPQATTAPFSTESSRVFKSASLDLGPRRDGLGLEPAQQPGNAAPASSSQSGGGSGGRNDIDQALKAVAEAAKKSAVVAAAPTPNPAVAASTSAAVSNAPPAKAGVDPVVAGFPGDSVFISVNFLNVTGVRTVGNSLFGAGGNAISGTDPRATFQAAAEQLTGTAGNDIIYGDDPTRLGTGFAKNLEIIVNNSREVLSYTISGLPTGFTFDGGTLNGGTWNLNVPAKITAALFDGTYTLSNVLRYPADLALNANGVATSFVMNMTMVSKNTDGDTLTFAKTIGVVVTDVKEASNLLVASLGTDYTLVLPARGISNVISALGGDDVVYGGAANDVIDGGTGADTMEGRGGNDTYVVDNTGDVVVEVANEGTDLVQASVSTTLSANVENLTLTGTADINATGNTLANVLTGNSGNNILSDGGAGGSDTLIGGTGNDTYVVNNVGDVITENASEGTDLVQSSVSFTLPTNVENIALTGTADINATGNSLANTLTGNSGNNMLDGGAGADTMAGGAGDDTYVVDNSGDVVTEASTAGTDLVQSSISYTLTDNVENLTLTGTNNNSATGNALDNVLTGNAGNNLLDGGGGADRLVGGSGNDTYVVDNTSDLVEELSAGGTDLVLASVSTTLSDNVENLTLTGSASLNATGNALDNVLTGNTGNNLIDGGLGADSMIGGLGDDTYVVDNSADTVTEISGQGTDLVRASISYALGDNIDNLTLTGATNINATGNSLANVLTGNLGDNLLDGGSGADTLLGGAGNDAYVVDNPLDVVTELANEGTDLVQASVSYTLGNNLENLTLTGSSNINATGNSLTNTLIGNSGSNTLDGGLGADAMSGGAGDDTYLVDNTLDVLTEIASEGTDLVLTSVSYTLGANLENMTLQGSDAINATGNALTNVLLGNSNSNVLDGGLGADTLIGGDGDDSYVVDNIGDVVTEASSQGTDLVTSSVTYTLSANVENLTLSGISNINAIGNSAANVLIGNSGNNVLDDGGSASADTLIGGLGNDTYLVSNVGASIIEQSGQGTDNVISSVNFTLSADVENLTLTSLAVSGTGNTLANIITGNTTLANTLSDGGGTGIDTLIGGAGNDTYNINVAGAVVTEASGAGTDLVQSSVSYTLGDNVENLTLTGSSTINATGNSLVNVLVGNSAANTLDGGAGADSMAGGGGNDTYVVDNTADVVSEASNAGTDLVQSSVTFTLSADVENLTLTGTDSINATGNSAINVLTGNSGDNTLDGGAGADSLVGGLGNDTYVVDNTGDTITELSGQGIDLVLSSVSYTLADQVDNLTLTGTAAISATGNALINVLVGNSGDNTLDGGAGADTMAGGLGNDTYVVDNIADIISENSGAGTDLVLSSVSYTLGSDIESLTLTGNANLNATGNSAANTLIGNSGDNNLDGGAGADTLIGGAGSDVYTVDNTLDVVTENANEGTDLVQSSISYTLSANVENLTLTGTANLNATGNTLNNVLTGNSGDNTLDGGTGADTLYGGAGNDTYLVDSILDFVIENPSEGTDTVLAAIDYTLGANLENLTLSGSAITGVGNALNNTITGNSNANLLDGGVGADTLIGGFGDDTYTVDNTGDVVTELIGEGADLINSSVTYTLSNNVENLTLTGISSINATGNSDANILTGNVGNNILDGGAGADTMLGSYGNDTYIVDNTGDTVFEFSAQGTDLVISSINYTLLDDVENLTLTGASNINATGNTLVNVLTGNSGDNTLDGGTGADTMIGGLGNDTYVVDNTSDTVTEASGAGTDLVQSSVTYTLSSDVENLTLTGTAAINATGNTLVNVLTGNSGNNTLDGGTGADTMIGGLGNDTYVVDNTSDTVTEASGAGTDLVQSSVTYTLSSDVENLTLTGTAVSGTGNTLANIITGNTTLANTLNDGGGAVGGTDTLIGGSASDTYIVGVSTTVITDTGGAADLVQSSVSYTLGANLENLTLTGASNINATGNTLVNVLTGNSGNNTLDGGTGADTMIGGLGNDTYVVDNTSDTVTEASGAGTDLVQSSVTYTLSSDVENLTLTGTAVSGTGNTLANIITGNTTLANTLNDGGGAVGGTDTLIGGSASDTYIVGVSTTVITDTGGAADLVQSSVSYTLGANLENLTLTGASNINATGNTLVNVLTGNSGNNTLDGGTGADTMIGGLGNDTYVVDNTSDTVTEASGAGTDLVQSSVTYTLSSDVENLTLTGTAVSGTGNTLANIITGNTTLANTLNDGGGAVGGTDTLIGGSASDTYIVGVSTTVITDTGGAADLVQSSVSYTLGANLENLTLTGASNINATGNTLVNVLTGNSGNNTLDGGTGADTMIGGLGNDTYVVDNTSDTVTEASGAGTDLVQSSVTYTLSSDVENLTLTGTAVSGTGNTLANIITGNTTLANTLNDGGGAVGGTDTLIGGSASDTYIVGVSTTVITDTGGAADLVQSSVSYTLGANLENLTLTGASNINATGNTLVNVLTGNSGDNTLDGGTGADTMIGGLGNDTYVVDNTSDTVTEASGAGTDLVQSSVTYTLSSDVENLTLTGTAAINATGNTLVNVLTGNSGNNTLDGGTGADTMIGGLGNDTYVVDNTSDTVTEASGAGTDLVQSSVTYTLSSDVENLTLTGTAVSGTGNTLANIITGNTTLANTLNDGGGAVGGTDTLIGGSASDTYIVGVSTTVITDTGGAADLVQSSVSYTLGANLENLTLTGASNINATGNTLVNVLTGNSGNNTLDGGTGADTMIGGLGNDTYVVDNTSDTVTEASGAGTDLVQSSVTYTLSSDVENLTLTGTAVSGTGNTLANIITGNTTLANTLNDGGGAVGGTDTLIGGSASDTYIVGVSTTVITDTGGAADLVQSSVSYTLGANLENLTLTGASNINATGNTLVNVLTGNSGNNTLDGGTGADTMIGGLGNDTYVVDNTSDTVTEASGAGTDLVQSSVTYTLSSDVENLTLTGTAVSGTGNTLANIITGNTTLANTLNDGGGAVGGTDTLIGGSASDTYIVGVSTTVITDTGGAADLVQSSVSYTLGANLENLTLTGGSALTGTGNTLANVITGNAAASTLVGGDGNDTYVVSNISNIITETSTGGTDLVQSSVSYTLATNVENLTLTGASVLTGTGNTLANVITGNAAASTLVGGDGNDTYVISNGSSVITETSTGGTDLVQSSVTYTLAANVENLTLTGTAVSGTGNTLANIITGNTTLANTLSDGGAGGGIDTLIGGSANDTYTVSVTGAVITEGVGAGTDLVNSSVSYTLGSNVENLTLTSSAATQAIGNSLNNTITVSNSNISFLTLANGSTGTDSFVISGLVNNAVVNLNTLASKLTNFEVVDLKGDSINSLISIAPSAIQTISSATSLTLRLDSGDSVFIPSTDPNNSNAAVFYTQTAGGVYSFYNSDPTLGGASVIAQLTVTTV